MKTDVIFYELIKELPQIFFELIDKADTNPNIYTFIADENLQQKVLGFIQCIIFYKFPNLTLEEIEAMLDLDAFKNTRLYQSILTKTKLEAKLELIPKCVEKGMSIQEIAELL